MAFRRQSNYVPRVALSKLTARDAFRFVLLFGAVNFFADMTYESARSITGPFLGTLGASAMAVGFVAGFGELIGYGLRSITGFACDRTGAYWAVCLLGYAVNLLAVPALALAGNWPLAAALIVVERTGRAIRKPATEVMLAFAGRHMGQGWVFGLNEALDQAGATLGPLVVSLVLYLRGGYRMGFAILLVPALCTLAVLLTARHFFPRPQDLDPAGRSLQARGFTLPYWIYVAGGMCLAAGFADFSLIAFHFQKTHLVPEAVIPMLYAAANAMGAIGALVLGRLYDRLGLAVVLGAFLLGAAFAPMVFLGNAGVAGLGVVIWGVGMGAQESLLKPIVAGLIAANKRGTAFGLFDACFGVAWFLGSALMGFLYMRSIVGLVVFSVAAQLMALPIFVVARAAARKGGG
jgi:predicted MFS family arabinose efflux permease